MVPMYGGTNYMHRPPERPRTTGQANNAPRQLEFSEAMKDFKHMFPTLDREVIEAVLRANNGLVDATIDQLLSMGLDMEVCGTAPTQSEHPPLPSYSDLDRSEPPPAYTPRNGESLTDSSTPSRPLPARPYSAWNPPLLGKLPDDFLRLGPSTMLPPSGSRGLGDSMGDRELERFLEDEKLAMVLQNEEFMRELRHNKDFMLSLEKDRQRNTAAATRNIAPVETPASNVSTPAASNASRAHYPRPQMVTSSPAANVEPAAGAVGGHPVTSPAAGAVGGHAVTSPAAGAVGGHAVTSPAAGAVGGHAVTSPAAGAVGGHAVTSPAAGAVGGHAVTSPSAGAVGGHAVTSPATHDDAVLRERLKHMGKSTRKKFDKLAKMFHRKNVNRANLIATGTAASTANLLDGYNEDDDDDELLNAMGSGRLEIMDERDEEKENKTVTQQKPSESEQKKAPGSVEPIVFFSEDNEFEYKEEK